MGVTESQRISFTIIAEEHPAEGSVLSRFGVGLQHSMSKADQMHTLLAFCNELNNGEKAVINPRWKCGSELYY